MYTALIQSTEEKVLADEIDKTHGPFICESCRGDVIIKQGYIRDEHFAHKAFANCDYAGESMEHLRIKKEIYNWLKETIGSKVKNIELEKHLGDVRPDVYVEGTKKKIAIEVQASSLTAERIITRTKRYYEKGIYVLWVLPYDKSRFIAFHRIHKCDMACEFRMLEFERVINYMSFKTLIFWEPGGFIVGNVEDSFTDGSEYYDTDGNYQSHAPYKKKMIKILGYIVKNQTLGNLHLSDAKEFEMPMGKYTLPARKIVTFDWRKVPGAIRKRK